jgi:hypothetical protein
MPIGSFISSGIKCPSEDVMASEKSIVEKLHLKPGMTILFIDSPPGYTERIGRLPDGVRIIDVPEKDVDIVQAFVESMSEFESLVTELRPFLKSSSIIWVTYPKGTSGIETDLNRDIIWKRSKELGMEASANFAVDEVWSAMRLKSSV